MSDRLRSSRRRFLTSLSALGIAGVIGSDAAAPDGGSPQGTAGLATDLDLARVRCADFAACLATPFVIHPEGGSPAVLELVRARELRRARPGEPRNPFSLMFRGTGSVRLAQQTCRVEHERLGSFPLFLVPTGPFREQAVYEAIFG